MSESKVYVADSKGVGRMDSKQTADKKCKSSEENKHKNE